MRKTKKRKRYDYDHGADYLERTFVHEMGHNIDFRDGYPSGPRFSEGPDWTNAIAADLANTGRKSPTQYGENANAEDFAGSLAEQVRDTAAFASDFPARYAAFEGLFGP